MNMRPLKRGGMAAAAFVLAACGGPLGPLAGGELSGQTAAPPAQWDAVPETIQLEVRPDDPYSVNLWSVSIGPHLYVATDPDGSTWNSLVLADNRVRARVSGTVYPLRAVVVQDAEERERVVDAYTSKYGAPEEEDEGFAPIRERREEAMEHALDNMNGTIYRLQAR